MGNSEYRIGGGNREGYTGREWKQDLEKCLHSLLPLITVRGANQKNKLYLSSPHMLTLLFSWATCRLHFHWYQGQQWGFSAGVFGLLLGSWRWSYRASPCFGTLTPSALTQSVKCHPETFSMGNLGPLSIHPEVITAPWYNWFLVSERFFMPALFCLIVFVSNVSIICSLDQHFLNGFE